MVRGLPPLISVLPPPPIFSEEKECKMVRGVLTTCVCVMPRVGCMRRFACPSFLVLVLSTSSSPPPLPRSVLAGLALPTPQSPAS